MKSFSSKMSIVLVLSSLAFLPSCDWLKSKLGLVNQDQAAAVSAGAGDEVVATADGKPLLYRSEVNNQLKMIIEMNPQIAQIEGIEDHLANSMAMQKLISRKVNDEGLNKTKEYLQQQEAFTQMLNGRTFAAKHQPVVTEEEKKAYFDKNKENLPEAMVSRGGVPVSSVSFAKEADAKAFLEKAKAKVGKLEEVAKDAKLSDKFRDYKLVHANSYGIEPVLREKVLAIKKSPATELVKINDTTYYVVYVGAKEAPKYRTYEEVKSAIEQRLASEKQNESLEKALEQLKAEYKFEMKKSAPVAPEIENDQQLEVVMPEKSAQETSHAQAPARAA